MKPKPKLNCYFRSMLKQSFLFCLFILCITTACNRKEETLYKVVKVKDGDTIELLSADHQNITVRLAEIDCPEKSQAFGQAAKQFTANLCFGKMVKLTINSHDRYGRTVGHIELTDGTNLNYELVKNGFAWQYRAYSRNMELSSLEQNARESKLGLWQDANPIPPWDFRKEKKSIKTTHPKKARIKTDKHRLKRHKKQLESVNF